MGRTRVYMLGYQSRRDEILVTHITQTGEAIVRRVIGLTSGNCLFDAGLPIFRPYGTVAHIIEARSTNIASLRDLPAALAAPAPLHKSCSSKPFCLSP